MEDLKKKSSTLFLLLLGSISVASTASFAADHVTTQRGIANSGVALQEHLQPLEFAKNLKDKLNGVSTFGDKVSRAFVREGCGYFARIQVAVENHGGAVAKRAQASAVEVYSEIFA